MSGLNGEGLRMNDNTELGLTEGADCVILSLTDKATKEGMGAYLPPDQAMEIGKLLVKYGHHLKTGKDEGMSEEMIEKIRARLKIRVNKMMQNMTDRKAKPEMIASEVVDACLREVL